MRALIWQGPERFDLAELPEPSLQPGQVLVRSEVFDMFDPFGVPTLPQVFNRNERPSLGPYCGELD
jgi:hypothetical protein